MRLASFIIISAGLHGAFAVCPTPFPGSPGEQRVPVTLISLEEASGGPASRGGFRDNLRAPAPRAKAAENVVEKIVLPPKSVPAGSAIPPANDFAFIGEEASGTLSTTVSFGAAGGMDGSGNGSAGLGQSEMGPGGGSGKTTVKNNGRYTRARYSDAPKPTYPETARRDGKEGRVLLRVLVNEAGRSAAVEVNHSSGVEALDQAAVEAIKRWRFLPARHGDSPVESWVRIPIDFRLSDALD